MKRISMVMLSALFVMGLTFARPLAAKAQMGSDSSAGDKMEGTHKKNDCPYCKMMAPHMADNIKTLREASDTLKTSNPDLSKKLSDMADMKEDIMKKMKEDMAADAAGSMDKGDTMKGDSMMKGSMNSTK